MDQSRTAGLDMIFAKPGITLSNQVYDEVLRMIIETPLQKGSRLPTEAELCERLSVSRTVVREALSRLKIDGLIETRRGRGSVVVRRPSETLLKFAPLGSIADIQRFFELRQIFECEVAALAAARRTEKDLAGIRGAYDRMEQALLREELATNEDFDFHLSVCMASHNKYLVSVMEFSQENYLFGMKFARELTTDSFARRARVTQNEHQSILEAIERGDAEAARRNMLMHLMNTRDRIFVGTAVD